LFKVHKTQQVNYCTYQFNGPYGWEPAARIKS